MIIYCITVIDQKLRHHSSNYHATLAGVCNYIMSKYPIDNKLTVYDSDTAGQYDINSGNLNYLIEQSKKNDQAAMFSITSDFFVAQIKTTFTLSTIKVKD